MESVAAHKDEVTHVESKIEELKRKSVDAKDVADHEAKNGNDEPVVKKIRKEAGDTDEDEKAHSPESRSAVAELDEDGTEDDASTDTKGTNGTSEHVNGSNGEHVGEHQNEKSDDGSDSESEKGDAPSVDKESNEEASD
ncbi:putative prothymosin alpha-B [Schistosoma mansoni]|uniref:putative prothymosin alpha-B n=1 Tax=Schistosoma mansoni TaxID=6183 RepID=UPI00022DCC5F|nr:putative prothymosin alpha-B [Schistosoma mansoni]|eukprot:XP_018654788.1 putative prothymosin alpha-B [Schistosoma mansoni]